MQSIAQFNPDSQCGRVIIYPLGCSIPSPLRGRRSGTGGAKEVKRGEITGFTAAARRRMRRAMLTLWIPDAQLVGITLTVPWKGETFDCEEFRECLHRFEVAFRRQYPHSGMIFRVELQKRGAPHVHALLYLAVADTRTPAWHACAPHGGAAWSAVAELELGAMWRAAVPDLHHGSLAAFERFGCKVEPIADAGAMFRYLADHASKHKQAQLGYKGKQWGIVGRKNLVKREPVVLPRFPSLLAEAVFDRNLRKVMRYRLQASRHNWKRLPPFGSVLKGSRRTVGEFYLRADTVRRLWEWSVDWATRLEIEREKKSRGTHEKAPTSAPFSGR